MGWGLVQKCLTMQGSHGKVCFWDLLHDLMLQLRSLATMSNWLHSLVLSLEGAFLVF